MTYLQELIRDAQNALIYVRSHQETLDLIRKLLEPAVQVANLEAENVRMKSALLDLAQNVRSTEVVAIAERGLGWRE
jgi:hypothetical protein